MQCSTTRQINEATYPAQWCTVMINEKHHVSNIEVQREQDKGKAAELIK